MTQLKELQASVSKRIAQLKADSVNSRLWAHDPTLWTDDPVGQAEVKHRLGWLDLPETSRDLAKEATAFAQEVKDSGITKTLLLGMGGSSLGPEVMSLIFNLKPGKFAILDSTDPAQVAEAAQNFPPTETLYIVASKSGGTAETMSAFYYFWEQSGGDGSRFIAITDAGSGLEKLARESNFRKIFLADSNVGGRYSALTAFGLVPAALMGVDLDRALDSAAEMMAHCAVSERSEAQTKGGSANNPGILLGAVMGEAALAGRDKLTLITDTSFNSFGAWAEQLIAESTGKEGKGIIPVDGESLLAADKYEEDRLFVYLRQDGAHDELIKQLGVQNHPIVVIPITNHYSLFTEFYRWEYATAIACHILGVNAFDQPNVEAAKIEARAQIDAYNQNGMLDEGQPVWEQDGVKLYADFEIREADLSSAFDSFLAQGQESDYVALQAYLPRNPQTGASLKKLRDFIQGKTGLATTLGYGPRFLHSTGQLHKGGANNGIFIQITMDAETDIEIPAQGMSFGTLERAQTLGDFSALLASGRRVLRVHLPSLDKLSQLQ
ncbi:MAG: glucose-6-phosphate isomerase [Anaerolineales bacterium]|uniref:Glucose-6-phosphate isomerase n=1 Tax=Candidatus Desulfolinea nitratireducens TaxID=2841698 RepID=A0A8J6TIU1_9CHLR|nr:glucose-6-phosphate isomerase [Candidatus Desulfolinea nitratireducens]MBL6960519.1 glucose-6-phosphate isomerase [Anaerolineales bacterium]